MSEIPRDEKQEKQEKREEKDEKGRGGWDEKWRNDPLSAITWAAILIWAGLVLLAENLGLIVPLEALSAWNLIFAGAGLIVLLQALVRVLVPAYRRPVVGTVILGLILIAIGLGDLFNWGIVWALIIVALGVSLLVRGVIRRQ